MIFDHAKVEKEWRPELEGMYGWFSDWDNEANSHDENWLGYYVAHDFRGTYGVCTKGPMVSHQYFANKDTPGTAWHYFYPDERAWAVWNPNCIFVAGMGDYLLVHKGDSVLMADTLPDLKLKFEHRVPPETVRDVSDRGFVSEQGTFLFCYKIEALPALLYQPYTDATVPEDILGKVVKSTIRDYKASVTGIELGAIYPVFVNGVGYTYVDFLAEYVYRDSGVPCGMLVNEKEGTHE